MLHSSLRIEVAGSSQLVQPTEFAEWLGVALVVLLPAVDVVARGGVAFGEAIVCGRGKPGG
jgi:hypothetical protein